MRRYSDSPKRHDGLKRRYKHKERPIQDSFFQELSFYPNIKPVFAIPNGGSRHILEAVALKRSGVKRGVPDVFVGIPTIKSAGLFIEFKAGSGKTSEHQVEMIDMLEKRGYTCKVCYKAEEAVSVLKEYLNVRCLNEFV